MKKIHQQRNNTKQLKMKSNSKKTHRVHQCIALVTKKAI